MYRFGSSQRKTAKIGKGRILMEGNKIAILGFGSIVQQCMEASNTHKSCNIDITVTDSRFYKPLDAELIKRLAKEYEILIAMDEGCIGGFGSHVSHFLSLNGLLDGPLKLRTMMLPDIHIEHGSPKDQIEKALLSLRHISSTIFSLMGKPKEAL